MSKDSYKNGVDKEVEGLQNYKIERLKDYIRIYPKAIQNTSLEIL